MFPLWFLVAILGHTTSSWAYEKDFVLSIQKMDSFLNISSIVKLAMTLKKQHFQAIFARSVASDVMQNLVL